MTRPALAGAALAALALALPPARGDAVLYRKVVPSAVLFQFAGGVGSGVLVDANRRLVATAAHVVDSELRDGQISVKAVFPSKDKAGRVVTDAVVYRKRPENVAVGSVVYFNRAKDLALVKLDSLPPGAVAVPLATDSPDPGEPVHVIGNSNISEGGVFGYSEGKVRNVHFHDKGGRVFYSLTHHAPTNKGDSGGPVLDSAGRLLGIVSQGTTGSGDRQVVDNSVHVAEVRRALEFLRQPGGAKLVVRAAVDAPGDDEFFLPVSHGAEVVADLKGSGKTDLDLFVEDVDAPAEGKGKKAAPVRRPVAETGDTDEEHGEFTAGWGGYARVKVSNIGKKGGAANPYTLTVGPVGLASAAGEAVAAPLTAIRRIAAKGDDAYELAYPAGAAKARVSIRGDGDTELSLTVEDAAGKAVGQAKCRTELADVAWVPAAGTYTVKVRNPGNVWNRYVLTTD